MSGRRRFYFEFLEREADAAHGELREKLIATAARAFLVEAATARLDEHVLSFCVRRPDGGYLGKGGHFIVVAEQMKARRFKTRAGAWRLARRFGGRVVKLMFPRVFRENVRRVRAELDGAR